MKTFIKLHLLFFIFLSCVNDSPMADHVFKDIDAATAKNIIEQEEITVIDIRTENEYKSGHIPGAINIDFSSLEFDNMIKSLNPGKKYLVYCRSGNRSSISESSFKKAGFRNIYHLNRGINDWIGNGFKLDN
ncbi:MAG: rhodanese-like domain-containing protein [Spirochaetes bacterium]|nr:rhodanese-like domain-containing protein [Spirochaetota bacterium]MBN2770406.1 rhodanese-like domain-containing protein [Spirochaetota bacterium]